MFTQPSHLNHSSGWTLASPSCSNSVTCMACLLEVLNSPTLSQVHKQMSLDTLKLLVTESDVALHLLAAHEDMVYHIIDLITDCYSDDPHRPTALSLIVSLVHKLQDEKAFEMIMDKFQQAVENISNEQKIHFFLLTFGQLCDVSVIYTQMLLSAQVNTIDHLLACQGYFNVDTTTALVCLLTHMMKLLSPLQLSQETDTFLWRMMVNMVYWLNMAENHCFQACCLRLLKECVQHQELTLGLLLVGQSSDQAHSLLMGLKRILVTKDERLVFAGTQCLTLVMDSLKGTLHIQEVFDTDLAEFVFELLHTSETTNLDCVFQCLQTMAGHKRFFDKCHAVYGLNSTLLAIQEALDSGQTVIVDTGISFFTCLMEGQPENMPLFVNETWMKSCHVLNSCLRHNKLTVFLAALQATGVFLGTKHQQNPVDVTAVVTLVSTATAQSQHYMQALLQQSQERHVFHIVTIMSDVVLANVGKGNSNAWPGLASVLYTTSHHYYGMSDVVLAIVGLLASKALLCGNMVEQIQELEAVVRDMCSKLILPWVMEHWHYLSDSRRIEKFLACLDVHLSAGGQDHQATITQFVATGHVCRILSLSHQTGCTEDTRRLIGHVVAGMFLQLARYQRPKLELQEEMLISGFSSLKWQDTQPGPRAADMVNSQDEVVAWFCLMYFSYLMGYRIWQLVDVESFLENILQRYPALLSFGMVVTRGFVYLQAICQTSDTCPHSVRCDQTEDVLMSSVSKSVVDMWFTGDPAVFKWSLLTERRADTVGLKLIEYWLLHLVAAAGSGDLQISSLACEQRRILSELQNDYLFLHCLVVLLNTVAVAGLSRDILLHCLSALPEHDDIPGPGAMWEHLYLEVIHRFEALFVHTEIDVTTSINMLPVMCQLVENPRVSVARKTSSLKSVYHAVKLAGMSCVRGISLTWTLKYLASVTSNMSPQDARTVLPALVKDDHLLDILQDSMCSSDTSLSVPALNLCAWLAATQHHYQPARSLLVTSDMLMSALASCRYTTCLPVLRLLKAVLSTMTFSVPLVNRCVQFVKLHQNFTSSTVFSTRELKQVYLYLQEIVVKEDLKLRTQAVECMKVLFHTDSHIGDYSHMQPWNSLMLESVLTTTIESGLTVTELDLCQLFISDMERVWTSNAVNSFLLALLSSNVDTYQLERAAAVVGQVRWMPGVDKEVLALADKYLTGLTPRDR